ncbi:hypothetical protein LshimejAT787_1205190 [Lyophyllum shimeji]|uniref:Uncharacterized protein n=1 Tax=Lyophyllum shimeji TaxID=47721 RepID=A0A9P3PW22_LYOSH|nr:hypothetical protein LshimejAT787_1205190 [Lyophyllum shimeji]
MGCEQFRPPPVDDDVPAAPFFVPDPHPGIPVFTGARGMTISDGEFEVPREIRTVCADGTQDIERPSFGGFFNGARGVTIVNGEFEVAREIRTVYADGTQHIERPFFGGLFNGARDVTIVNGEFEVPREIRTVYADGTEDIERPFFGSFFNGARGVTILGGEFEVPREIRTVYADGTQHIERPFFEFPPQMFRDAVGTTITGGRFTTARSIVTYGEGPPTAPASEGANASNYIHSPPRKQMICTLNLGVLARDASAVRQRLLPGMARSKARQPRDRVPDPEGLHDKPGAQNPQIQSVHSAPATQGARARVKA